MDLAGLALAALLGLAAPERGVLLPLAGVVALGEVILGVVARGVLGLGVLFLLMAPS